MRKNESNTIALVFLLRQGRRDCIRKFLRMQKLRVTLAVVAICNLFRPKFLDTSRSLFRRSLRSLLTNRVLSYDSKAGRPFFFLWQGGRDCIRKFLRMQKLRVTLAFVTARDLYRPKPLDTSRSLFRRSHCSLLTNRVLSYDSKAGRPFFFLWQGRRDSIRKFLRMQKLRVTLAVVTARDLYRSKPFDTSRSSLQALDKLLK